MRFQLIVKWAVMWIVKNKAEEVGFEPTVPCGTTVFKTAAFDHSATPPSIFDTPIKADIFNLSRG